MTSRERLQTVLAGRIPDCVPVAPDFSNMIPARRTGKPFWDLYLYNDPPIWDAYVDCAKHFDIDSLMDGYFPLQFPDLDPPGPEKELSIVYRSAERIVTRRSYLDGKRRIWDDTVDVYYLADPPTWDVNPAKLGLPPVPDRWEPVEGRKPVDLGPEGFRKLKERLGDQGLVGVFATSTIAIWPMNEDSIYRYYDNPDMHQQWADERLEAAKRKFERILAMDVQPDFLCVGGSGTLVYQTLDMVRELAMPAVSWVIEQASARGIPTHVHSCGPESALVKMFAEVTNLTVIDPLEPPPMGDCCLADLKRDYGDKIILKGNLHTTEVMLRGSPDDVRSASRKAIDDAGAGGRFILSTADQCGRDTPDENLHAMVETARTYGRY